jgi:hypothetical protein
MNFLFRLELYVGHYYRLVRARRKDQSSRPFQCCDRTRTGTLGMSGGDSRELNVAVTGLEELAPDGVPRVETRRDRGKSELLWEDTRVASAHIDSSEHGYTVRRAKGVSAPHKRRAEYDGRRMRG